MIFRRRRNHLYLLNQVIVAVSAYFSDDAETEAYYFDDAITLRYVTEDA